MGGMPMEAVLGRFVREILAAYWPWLAACLASIDCKVGTAGVERGREVLACCHCAPGWKFGAAT